MYREFVLRSKEITQLCENLKKSEEEDWNFNMESPNKEGAPSVLESGEATLKNSITLTSESENKDKDVLMEPMQLPTLNESADKGDMESSESNSEEFIPESEKPSLGTSNQPRRRGRPRKYPLQTEEQLANKIHKKRGRPRKYPLMDSFGGQMKPMMNGIAHSGQEGSNLQNPSQLEGSATLSDLQSQMQTPIKRGRGRPRKDSYSTSPILASNFLPTSPTSQKKPKKDKVFEEAEEWLKFETNKLELKKSDRKRGKPSKFEEFLTGSNPDNIRRSFEGEEYEEPLTKRPTFTSRETDYGSFRPSFGIPTVRFPLGDTSFPQDGSDSEYDSSSEDDNAVGYLALMQLKKDSESEMSPKTPSVVANPLYLDQSTHIQQANGSSTQSSHPIHRSSYGEHPLKRKRGRPRKYPRPEDLRANSHFMLMRESMNQSLLQQQAQHRVNQLMQQHAIQSMNALQQSRPMNQHSETQLMNQSSLSQDSANLHPVNQNIPQTNGNHHVQEAPTEQVTKSTPTETVSGQSSGLSSSSTDSPVSSPQNSAKFLDVTGSCLCGSIALSIHEPLPLSQQPVNCHCCACRKQLSGSSPFVPIGKSNLSLSKADTLHSFTNSTQLVKRSFCAKCGSNLFSEDFKQENSTVWVSLGCIDTDRLDEDTLAILKPKCHIYVKDKPTWSQISDGLPQFSENISA